ncbi:hypothetical protein KR032_005510 [Drosophila birchii]|nr:hypothetical protein KR032_005510 [Drosophila birchii]
MSENQKNNSCLHCSVFNTKYQYQEIFDEFGTELGLQALLAKHFQLDVAPDPLRQQLLCEVCVNMLIRLFDIDELQRQQDAAKARNKDPSSEPPQKTVHPVIPAKPATAAVACKKAKKPAAAAPSPPTREPSARISKRVPPPQVLPAPSKPSGRVKEPVKPDKESSLATPKDADQEHISVLIQNLLDDDAEMSVEVADDAKPICEEVETIEEAPLPGEPQTQRRIVLLNKEATREPSLDEDVYIYEHEDILETAVEKVNVVAKGRSSAKITVQAEESQSEGETEESHVVVFDFVMIKEKDDIKDIYEYLSTVVKTSFEKLTFEWPTSCRHCPQKFTTFESLLSHTLKSHRSRGNAYKCPVDGCIKELKGSKFLAMHLVVLHAPVAEIPIYGSCPECKMTFSNILQYNKHSCAHMIKKKRGVRLYCEMCAQEFPSWKRFNFHNQFHLEKHRPRACFVCEYASTNIDDLFQHLNYSHEPAGTLFCDLYVILFLKYNKKFIQINLYSCDRTFRDPGVFMEHNKSHANVSSTTYPCGECMAVFESRGRLNGHMRSMHGTIISCELCSREFGSEATYSIHMKKHLIIERDVHICPSCGMLSDSQKKMAEHANTKNSPCFGAKIYTEMLRDAYICEYCSSYFKQKSDLQAHRTSGIHKNGLFWCQPCGKDFPHMKLYRHHLRNFQKLRTDSTHRKLEICVFYMCDQPDCTEAYANWNSLYTHKRRTHESSDKQTEKASKSGQDWICQFCSKECRSKMSLSVHVARSHNNDNVVCTLCNASYKSQDALDKHHAYWHEPIECPQCFKIVKNRRNYDTHVNVVHSNKKRYTCGVCEKGFYHKSEMEAHQKLHGQLYSCEQCSFTTRNKKSLSVHVLGQHYKRFAFECKVCNKRFGRRQGLTTHIQRAHGSKYVCRDYFEGGCGRTFVSSSQLNVHVRKVHDGTILLQEEEEEDSDGPSTSKKPCYRIDDDSNIEFVEIGDGEDEEEMEDDHELIDDPDWNTKH